ncbi:MAG: PepSY domain-containing protein [Thiohalomonadaceae bacterium]
MTHSFKKHLELFGLLLILLFVMKAGLADDSHDHDRARRAVEAGEMLPLRIILTRIDDAYPGQVMKVRLERKNDLWIYKIKVLRKGGALIKLKIDAHDGTILSSEQKSNASGED